MALRQQNVQQNREILHEQLLGCMSVKPEAKAVLEEFLYGISIDSLEEVTDSLELLFLQYLSGRIRNQNKRKTYLAALKKCRAEYQAQQYEGLLLEVKNCTMAVSIKKKAVQFLMDQKVKSLSGVDYQIRERYEAFLRRTIAKSKVAEYVKGLDRLKLHQIKQHCLKKPEITYTPEKLYLSYLPVYEIAKAFYYIQDKESLIWDFSLAISPYLKKQIFVVLKYVLEHMKDVKDCKVRYLLPLKWLYEFCQRERIMDLELLENEQAEAFRKVLGEKVANVNVAMQIVGNVRKILFLSAKKTNWDAHVWFLERLVLDEARINPSNPVVSLSFLEVSDVSNRQLWKAYTKYQIGIGSRALCTIRREHGLLLEFLRYLDQIGQKVAMCTVAELEVYFRMIDKEILPETYNGKVVAVYRFYHYLKVKHYVEQIPFSLAYYLKHTVTVHHDRSVDGAAIMEILHNLHRLPLNLRLMYLHLFCVGLRLNEVCTLKGNAYVWQNDIPWIRVYQYKLRLEKMVPIPKVLFDLMVSYIQKNQIGPDEYIFQSQKGEAYVSGTFRKQMKRIFSKLGLAENVPFQAHAYRHNVATYLYAQGASLQAIREYLGHDEEEMTMQYIDYIPKQIEKKNEVYFEENNLAARLEKEGGLKGGKQNTSV